MSSTLPPMASFAEQLTMTTAPAPTSTVSVSEDGGRRRQIGAGAAYGEGFETDRKVLEDGDGGTRAVSEAEIREHNDSKSSSGHVWVVVDGVVYDISPFLHTHPGGVEAILEHLDANDIGKVMRGEEGGAAHSHSRSAFRMLQQFRIGHVLKGGEEPSPGLSSSAIHASTESKYTVDLTKPLVFQVGKLGADYDEWVHDPIVQKEPPRFFKSDIAEFFTRTAWWAIPTVWGPCVVYLGMIACKEGLRLWALPFSMAAGAFIWTFIEYFLHRFIFHMKTSSYWSNTAHYFLHGFHHKHPMDGTRLVFPPTLTGIIVVIIYFLTEPLSWVVGRPMKLGMLGGGILMYIAYDLTHYFLHFGTPFGETSRTLKRLHLNHHFNDQTNSFGVTTPFWDTVFDTFPGVPQAKKVE